MSSSKLHYLRKDYEKGSLNESMLPSSPFELFGIWFNEAVTSGIIEPNAMLLSTSGNDCAPASRTVLLKEFSVKGFEFYTNYKSRKALQIGQNPQVALHFLWLPLERQIKIEGKALKVARKKSIEYFATRPRESQIGSWASPQSTQIESRAELEKARAFYEAKFEGQKVICPPHWGGYIVAPSMLEFWQGGQGRLHDRIVYKRTGSTWRLYRLAP